MVGQAEPGTLRAHPSAPAAQPIGAAPAALAGPALAGTSGFRHRLRPSRRRHCPKKRMLPDGQRLQRRLPSTRMSASTALSGRTRMRPEKNRSWSRPPSGLLPVKHSWMWSRRGWMARMPSSGRTTWRRGARRPHRSPGKTAGKPLLPPALRANCPARPSRWALMCRRVPSRWRYVGEIFKTYILAEARRGDLPSSIRHAAHERPAV